MTKQTPSLMVKGFIIKIANFAKKEPWNRDYSHKLPSKVKEKQRLVGRKHTLL